MSPTRSEILAFVNTKPRGVTTHDVQRQLGGAIYTISSILSKAAAYGIINARPIPHHHGRANLYIPKQQLMAAE
jgi:hypothetical protein